MASAEPPEKTESCFEAWALRSFLWEGVRWGLVGGWLGGMELQRTCFVEELSFVFGGLVLGIWLVRIVMNE